MLSLIELVNKIIILIFNHQLFYNGIPLYTIRGRDKCIIIYSSLRFFND